MYFNLGVQPNSPFIWLSVLCFWCPMYHKSACRLQCWYKVILMQLSYCLYQFWACHLLELSIHMSEPMFFSILLMSKLGQALLLLPSWFVCFWSMKSVFICYQFFFCPGVVWKMPLYLIWLDSVSCFCRSNCSNLMEMLKCHTEYDEWSEEVFSHTFPPETTAVEDCNSRSVVYLRHAAR